MERAGEKPTDEAAARADKLIGAGSELAGAAAGGALGTLGGPLGVAAGATSGVIVTRALKRVGAEVQQRWLAPRQRARAGGAFAIAVHEMTERIESGQQVREDGFFDQGDRNRSSAEELLEGVLLHAAQECEERKVPYLGRFYAALAFREDITAAQANFLLRMLEQVTYRQLVMLAIFSGSHESRARLGGLVSARYPLMPRPQGEALSELEDLGTRGLAGFGQKGGSVATPSGTWGDGSFGSQSHIRVVPSPTGLLVVPLCGLNAIPLREQEEVFVELCPPLANEPELKFRIADGT